MKLIVTVLTIALLTVSCARKSASLLDQEKSDLKIGQWTEGTLQAQKSDTFRLTVADNAFVTGAAEQKTLDVLVVIISPDGEKSYFNGTERSDEPFYLSAAHGGEYKIVVVSQSNDGEGKYAITVKTADPIPATAAAAIDQLAKAIVGQGKRPGVSIAVVQGDQVVYSSGFGYADLEYDVAITPKTIFHIASVSKQFTSFAIAVLVDQGKISLDDDIRKYLPEMHDFGTPITINHLVHHTSGLRDQWNLLALGGWRLDDVITKNQIMRVVSRQTELNFKPGDEYYYCNTGFTLMAEIVSRVSGKTFPEWTAENIFQPLHMDHTLFYDDHEKIVPNRAYSYYPSGDGYKKAVLSYANAGATSLFTTVEDLSLWAMNFEKMTAGNEKIMKMMNQRFILNKGDTIPYAFGQVLRKYKGLNSISHGGGDAGYRTYLLRFPDQHLSISVFSNLGSFNPGGLSYAIADKFLADKLVVEPKKEEPKKEEKKEDPFDPKSVRLNDYLGTFYSDELQTTYTMVMVNDTLTAQHQRHDDIKLKPTKKDTFEASAWFMGEVVFTKDNKDKVTGMSVSNGRVRNLRFSKHQ